MLRKKLLNTSKHSLINWLKIGRLIRMSKIKKPYFESLLNVTAFMLIAFFSKWDPSKGGIGIKLNRNNNQLRFTAIKRTENKLFGIWKNNPKMENKRTVIKAIARLETGPARVIKISSLFLDFKLGSET